MSEIKINCEFCGKDIYRKPSRLKRYNHHFCDRRCRADAQLAKQSKGRCYNCGKDIIINAQRRRNSKTGIYFCDNKCKNPYIAKYKRWGNNPDSHRTRRPVVLEKSNEKCQNCGYNEDARMLDIHHINGNHRDNRWTNLSCLCVWCHVLHTRGVKIISVKSLFDKD